MKANGRTFPVVGVLSALVVGALLVASCDGGGEEITPTASPTAEVVTATPPPTEIVTATPPPTEVLTATPPPTEVLCPDTPRILRPEENDAVPMATQVEVEVEEPGEHDKHLYVLVRPIPDDPNQKYWVQARPTSAGNCRWISNPVYVGVETDSPGLPFALCAIVTDEILSRGESLRELPQGLSHCIDVTRQ